MTPRPTTRYRCEDCGKLLIKFEVYGGEDRESAVEYRCTHCGTVERVELDTSGIEAGRVAA